MIEQYIYINCKKEDEDAVEDVFSAIYKDKPGTIFLIDEITYLQNFDAYVGH